jgi:hypothetical protein
MFAAFELPVVRRNHLMNFKALMEVLTKPSIHLLFQQK